MAPRPCKIRWRAAPAPTLSWGSRTANANAWRGLNDDFKCSVLRKFLDNEDLLEGFWDHLLQTMLSERIRRIPAECLLHSLAVAFRSSACADPPNRSVSRKTEPHDCGHVKKSEEARRDKRGFEETMKRAKNEERCGEQVRGAPRPDRNRRSTRNAYPQKANEDD